MSQNPIQSFNRYAYGNNNPYKFVDPDGRLPILIPIAIFVGKEIAAEVASRYTGGATDFLSVRRMGTKGLKFATNKLADGVKQGTQDLAKGTGEKVTKKADFTVTPDGVAIPMNPNTLKDNLKQLDFQSTSKATSKKYVGEDSLGPMRVRIEKAHPSDPNFTGTPDPLHTVDHLHIDRRKNVTSGGFKSKEKIQYDWPF